MISKFEKEYLNKLKNLGDYFKIPFYLREVFYTEIKNSSNIENKYLREKCLAIGLPVNFKDQIVIKCQKNQKD